MICFTWALVFANVDDVLPFIGQSSCTEQFQENFAIETQRHGQTRKLVEGFSSNSVLTFFLI
jgi:hypothetical protein